MGNKINHCGKSIPVANRYAVQNYPGPGDITYFDYAFCQQCQHHIHFYQFLYFRKKDLSQQWLSDKTDRHVFQRFIDSGKAFIIPKYQDVIDKNTRAQVIASEWVLSVIRPADVTAIYLNKNESAPWVSTQSVDSIKSRRERWLSEYSKLKELRQIG